MNNLSKSILLTTVFTLFISIVNSYSQTEDEKISTLIEQKRAYNRNNNNSTVYKIQLYNGNEKEAYKIKQNFQVAYPEYATEIIYNAPEWKTHVGKYKTRLDADKVLIIIKEKFAGAIVLEDKI
ncbi:MAG: SPOR domain-containing protein [Bacteroidetes bacterium]|nr:SPOR domain-containing protein [Bacteroidota bacterium]